MGQQVLKDGHAQNTGQQESVDSGKQSDEQQQRADELNDGGSDRGCEWGREMHFRDLFCELPGRAVLKVSNPAFEFMPAMDVKDHQPCGHAEDQVAIGGWELAYARIQGGFKQCFHIRWILAVVGDAIR